MAREEDLPGLLRASGWQLGERIARSPGSDVYRARRKAAPGAGLDCALKVMRDGQDAAAMLRAFRREAGMLAAVGHPGLPAMYEVGEGGGTPYLAMELLPGGSLAARLRDGPLPVPVVLSLAVELAGTLAAAHHAGLVHRDVKPDNIVFDGVGRPRLIDFGLARGHREDEGGDRVIGTLRYCAPEQSGMIKRPVDQRSDLYALGAVLYECLLGQPPFVGADVGELLRAHAVLVPAPVSQGRADVPPALDALVAKLLAKDPDDRYHGADGLAADLARLVAGERDFELGAGDDPAAPRPERALVGRAGELSALTDQWRWARGGAGRLALVRGPSGSGKSRLLRELARLVHADGGLVIEAECEPDAATPFAPVRDAVDGLLRRLRRAGPAGLDGLAQVRAAAGAGAPLLGSLSPELAAVLDVPVAAAVEPDLFAGAVATFLIGLAQHAGGLLFCVHNGEWLDQASRKVLRRAGAELHQAPLLLAATLRTDDDSGGADVGPMLATGVQIGADLLLAELSDDAVAAVLADQLGGPLDPAFVGRLNRFVRGNPFAVVEFARALVAGGFISPSWGRSEVDEQALAQVEVAGDVVVLISRLVDRLGPAAQVLAAAAGIGERFELDLLTAVCVAGPELVAAGAGVPAALCPAGLGADDVLAAVTAGVEGRLIEPLGREEYAFVHHRVRELLLARLAPERQRELHQRIAAVLDSGPVLDPRQWYRIARHYAAGDLERAPRRAYQAGWAAARTALTDHAVTEAVGFLELAEQAAATGGFAPEPRFDGTAGAVRLASGELADAAERFTRALDGETDPRYRSALLEQLARVEYAKPNYPAAMRLAAQGLAELGRSVPSGPVASAASLVSGSLKRAGRLVWRRRAARPETRERLHPYLSFAEIAGRAAYQALPRRAVVAMTPHFLYAADRCGPSVEYVQAYLAAAMLAAAGHRPRSAWRRLRRAERAAREVADPRLLARVEVCRGHMQYFLGEPVRAGHTLTRVLTERLRWLPPEVSTEAIMALTVILDLRGHTRLSEQWRQRGLEVGLPSPTITMPSVVLGQAEEADAQLRWVDGLIRQDDAVAIGRTLWGGIVTCAVNVHLERGELGPELDRVIDAYHRHGPTVRGAKPYWQRMWLLSAYARLAQAREAPTAAERRRRLAQAQRAVTDLGVLGEHEPVLNGHWRVTQAALAQLVGNPEEALSRLTLADRAAEDYDAPWLRFEALVVRARALRATGRVGAGASAAELAVLLAEQQGWVYRAAKVRREFAVEGVVSSIESRWSGEVPSSAGSADNLRDRRYLEALIQVGTVASSVLDPRRLARVALDELLKILGAERAYLFACQSETAPLELYAGRDADGNDLDELVGYSGTVVERARAERRPLIVTGTDQGAAVGSRSAVAHGLRSIMVAPLQLEGRLLGVVYLDSRVAKGIFAAEDEEILVAIANQIAASLETARAAQLEVQVEAERRQRGLADQLREATGELSRTLDPEEVLNRGLELAADMVGADSGAVLLGEASTLAVGALYRRVASSPDAAVVLGSQLVVPQDMTAATEMVVGQPGDRLPESLAVLLARPVNWLLIPLSARGSQFGLLVLADWRPRSTSDRRAGVAAAFGSQLAIAYDNARLFRQVEQLATIDGLSNIFNRRHFMELAGREVSAARRHNRPLAAIMLDIDHFKRVNDTYGHATGDQVIRVVAERLSASLRGEDLLGRYGGEEFALLIPDTEAGATDLAERLRRVVEAEPIRTEDGPVPVTISVGVSIRLPSDSTPDTLFARADAALYQAKQNGRNQVALAPV